MNAPEKLPNSDLTPTLAPTSESNKGTGKRTTKPRKTVTPYLAARREWNAQFGSIAASANNWRLVAIISMLTTLLAIAGLVTLGARTKTVPFVSILDTQGRLINQGPASATTSADPRVVAAMIARFISNLRTVSTDGTHQKNSIFELFSMLSTGNAAFTVISDYLRGDGDPFEKAKTQTVSVDIAAILPMSANTFQAEWREVTRDRHGTKVSEFVYQAILTIKTQTVLDSDVDLKNPLGIYVTDINWTKKL